MGTRAFGSLIPQVTEGYRDCASRASPALRTSPSSSAATVPRHGAHVPGNHALGSSTPFSIAHLQATVGLIPCPVPARSDGPHRVDASVHMQHAFSTPISTPCPGPAPARVCSYAPQPPAERLGISPPSRRARTQAGPTSAWGSAPSHRCSRCPPSRLLAEVPRAPTRPASTSPLLLAPCHTQRDSNPGTHATQDGDKAIAVSSSFCCPPGPRTRPRRQVGAVGDALGSMMARPR